MAAISLKLLESRSEAFLRTLRAIRKDRPNLVEALKFNGDYPSRAGIVRAGDYKHKRRTEATDTYLMMSGLPQTTTQCAEALKKGGVKTKAKDDYKAQYAVMRRGEQTGRWHRYGLDHWIYS